ncbi:hypothetical protein BDV93DRAFT_560755 [Ceratobasidium sp. AG-I]|nr:hypothetical protein BDV93DRAFT_560755 [Ceratobasidium sp. AG-I]
MNTLEDLANSRFDDEGMNNDNTAAQSGDRQSDELEGNKSESGDTKAYNPEIDYPDWLTNVAINHLCEYDDGGELSNLEVAIEYMNEAILLTPDGNSKLPKCLKQVADMHDFLYARTSWVANLDKAIEYKTQVISLVTHDQSDMPSQLMDLGFSLKN